MFSSPLLSFWMIVFVAGSFLCGIYTCFSHEAGVAPSSSYGGGRIGTFCVVVACKREPSRWLFGLPSRAVYFFVRVFVAAICMDHSLHRLTNDNIRQSTPMTKYVSVHTPG